METPKPLVPQDIDLDRHLELLANTGLTPMDLAIGLDGFETGVPKPGTVEFLAMQKRVHADRTPDEVAAYEAEQIAALEEQFPGSKPGNSRNTQ